jgi:hypothetical protein
VTTDHLESRIWFRDDDDFVVGMNHVAIQAFLTQVTVLAFILMSNHVHFVLYGTWEECEAFIDNFKARYSQYLFRKYGIREQLRRNDFEIKELPYDDEAFEKAVAYTNMNCVAANICLYANQYPWGTGDCFFNPSRPVGKRLSDFSKRELKRILHSDFTDLPSDWIIGERGFILPQCYVNVKYVEEQFRKPSRMTWFLNNSSKAKRRTETDEKSRPAFRDQVILSAIPDLCNSLFRKSSVNELNEDEQAELLKQLRFRFSSNVNQLGRVTGLSYERVTDLLNQQ